jgi:hypothetical protein
MHKIFWFLHLHPHYKERYQIKATGKRGAVDSQKLLLLLIHYNYFITFILARGFPVKRVPLLCKFIGVLCANCNIPLLSQNVKSMR